MYSGQHLAHNEDIVVATVNYRLNLFGFPGAPEEATNLGLRDQRLAIKWLRDNIASFGGDPDLITIVGHSAGGCSVDYWSDSYVDDPIVKGIVALSGNALGCRLTSRDTSQQHWEEFTGALNCSSASNVLDCVRKPDMQEVVAALGGNLTKSELFRPTVDQELVFADFDERVKSGALAKIVSYTCFKWTPCGMMCLAQLTWRRETAYDLPLHAVGD